MNMGEFYGTRKNENHVSHLQKTGEPGLRRNDMMRWLHQALDRLNGRLVARRAQAPVASGPDDLAALATLAPGALHAPSAAADLTLHEGKPGLGGGDRLTFPSLMPCGHGKNDLVHAIRWRAGSSRSSSAVLMFHRGFAPSFTAEKLIAPPFLKAGIDVLALTLPWHMERAPAEAGYSGQYLLSGDVPRLVRGFAQGAQDAAALALALRAQGYSRVFAGGISLGGNIAGQVAVLAELDFVYMLIPAADPFVTLWQTPIGAGVVRAAQAAGFADETVAAAMRLITPRLLGPPRTPAERIRIVLGNHDLLCPPEPIMALANTWSVTDIDRLGCGHRSFALHLSGVRQRLAKTAKDVPPLKETTA